ncbi:MAG: SynChlorMet cassette radical SAM/SPASM protein ScmF [Syntrophobacterales bacterium]|nr:SynChlorMet cassette radical SAM/SPASM protein ScmF [Syntrophobacterales bacterium]
MTNNEPDVKPFYPLRQLYFYLTSDCNLRCRHCWIEPHYLPASQSSSYLDSALFTKILDQAGALGLNGVKFTGGEPLLHPRLSDLISAVQKRGLRLVVETNGTLCSSEIAEKIASVGNAFVSVSIDSIDPEVHEWVRGKKGCFDEAVAGIKNLVAAGLRPQIIMTVMQRNKDQLAQIVRMAEALGAGSVKFNIIQPTARGEQMFAAGETVDIAELILLGKWVDEELSATTSLSLYYDQPPAFRSLRRMFNAKTGDGCHTCGISGILGVLASGAYALCGIGETVSELVFGDAGQNSLKEVWETSPVLKDIRAGLPSRFRGICAECLLKNVCLGSCIAQNYYRDHDLWAPHWYCAEAYKQGLFPATRLRGSENLP